MDNPLPMIEFRNARRAHGFLVGGEMSPDQVVEAAQKGYKRIIDLRMPEEDGVAEEKQLAEESGIVYISLPIDGVDGLTEDNARKFSELISTESATERVPTIVHCRSGNRVGALFALEAFFVDGLPAEQALEIGRQAGLTKMEDAVKEKLGL